MSDNQFYAIRNRETGNVYAVEEDFTEAQEEFDRLLHHFRNTAEIDSDDVLQLILVNGIEVIEERMISTYKRSQAV